MPKTIVITGGTGGIGKQTAITLAKTGARVVVTGRDAERGEAGVRAIREASGNSDVHLALGDLSRVDQVRALARSLANDYPQIDVLINNAGLLAQTREVTADGIESNLAVNVVAPYVLTHALSDALSAARPARVINVTGGLPLGTLDIANLQAEKGFVGLVTYSHAKRALEAMTLELARELEPRGIHVHVVYPGTAATAMSGGMTIGMFPWWMRPLWPIFRLLAQRDDGGRGAAKASRSSVWAATTPDLEDRTGSAINTECGPLKLQRSVLDPTNQAQVVAKIRELARMNVDPPAASQSAHSARASL